MREYSIQADLIMTKQHRPGLIFATKFEAAPFIHGLSLVEIENNPFKIYHNNNIYLIISGIGKSNAAIAVTYLIMKYKIMSIFNIGAAGSTVNEIKVSDIFHISSIVEWDRPRLSDKGIRIKKPDMLDGFSTAVLCTRDRPVVMRSERDEVSVYAELLDMEGAAVLHACRLFDAKCYLFKIVTDTPEHENSGIIMKNIKKTAQAMYEFCGSLFYC